MRELSDLYYIKKNGEVWNSDCITFGSGKETADKFLKNVKSRDTTMKEFARRACLAIMFMNTQRDSRVGVEPNGFPTIIYIDYDQELDKEAPKKDIEEFRISIEKKFVEHDIQLENLINSF
jgi:20S proteasome alpha/beta subunit